MGKLKAVFCALFGHSRIITQCFGYVHCARCEAQLGDTLAGAYPADKCVILYHDCDKCRENAKALTWRDRLLVPDPFDPKKVAEGREALERAREWLKEKRAKETTND